MSPCGRDRSASRRPGAATASPTGRDLLRAPVILALAILVHATGGAAQDPADAIDSLPPATTSIDEAAGRITIRLPLIEVPAGGTVLTPVFRAAVPFDISLYGFAADVVDESGYAVPRDRLHHFIMTDPNRRELFLPLALPVFGASKESPSPVLPRYLFGMPLPASGRYLAAAMLTNPDDHPRKMQLRLLLSFIRPGRLFPLFNVYAWTMDVRFPLGGAGGRHDFDVPAGRSTYSWEGSPDIPGTIVAMGGHAHDYATSIELSDVTTGETIWRQSPIRDTAGHLRAIPIGRFYRWYRLGTPIEPSHTYRVAVVYDNPTGRTIPYGGMGSVVGLIVPARGASWPLVDPRDSIYRTQVRNLLNNMAGLGMGHSGHMAQ
jgi:hypothetical protein